MRWKGWSASDDTWEPLSHMLHAEAMIAQHHATGEEVRAGPGAKKQVKAQRRTVSKLQQLVYELGKFVCVQGGKGVKEDQKGIAFTKWCLLSDRKDQLLVHLRMKPVVGTRYHVYHYNPRVIFILRQVYLDFIESIRTSKTKHGLNRLEASIKNLLEDADCIAQMRAAAILNEQVEMPSLWLAKAKTALEMREVTCSCSRSSSCLPCPCCR